MTVFVSVVFRKGGKSLCAWCCTNVEQKVCFQKILSSKYKAGVSLWAEANRKVQQNKAILVRMLFTVECILWIVHIVFVQMHMLLLCSFSHHNHFLLTIINVEMQD